MSTEAPGSCFSPLLPPPAFRGRLLAALFFAAVFLYYFHPVKSGDFWWHLTSGRLIAQERSLPTTDPFAYTTTDADADRVALVLRGYWLAQLTYYAAYAVFSFWGVCALNAVIFTLIAYILWRLLARSGLDIGAALLMTLPAVMFGRYFDEVRPHAFSFLGVVLMLTVLEKWRDEGRSAPAWGSPLRLLPLIAIPWANMHRGFIVMFAVLGAYLSGELARAVRRRDLRPLGSLAFWSSMTALATVLTPNHVRPYMVGLREITGTWSRYSDILELMRPWEYAAFIGDWTYLALLLVVAATAAASMLRSWRLVAPEHLVLLAGLAYAGASAGRLAIFFVLAALGVSGRYLAAALGGVLARLSPYPAALALAACVLLAAGSIRSTVEYGRPVADDFLPVRAADFMEGRQLPGPIFNPFEWGGYLSWRLYPRYAVFTDGRFIDEGVHEQYEAGMQGMVRGVFSRYGVRTVIFYPVYPLTREVRPIALALIRDPAWRLTYTDDRAAIFVREDAAGGLPELDKRQLLSSLVAYGERQVRERPASPDGYNNLALISFAMGEWDKASEYLARAMALQSGKETARRMPADAPGLRE